MAGIEKEGERASGRREIERSEGENSRWSNLSDAGFNRRPVYSTLFQLNFEQPQRVFVLCVCVSE